MKLTLSVIKADIGSIGGHVAPSKHLQETVQAVIRDRAAGLILDHYISHTGDDVAILMTHTRGEGDEQIHKLAWVLMRRDKRVCTEPVRTC
jgi:fructose 1,6-bisphosphate aldolase/phosphatase